MCKYNAEKLKNQKLKQFRLKYLHHQIYVHLCGDCKRYSMMLHLENCVLCGAENTFYARDSAPNLTDSLLEQIMNDIISLESSDAAEIKPL